MPARAETELYQPVKTFLEERGFAVRGEVRGCDVTAVRGDDLVIVELKAGFTLPLVLQGIDRQKVTDWVYLAVETPRSARGRWSDQVALCRRLGLGLLTVSFGRRAPAVQVVCEPEPYQPRRDLRRRAGLLREFDRRSGDHNPGGSNRRKLITSYREHALRAARFLGEHGVSSTRAIRAGTAYPGTTQMLYDNVYGWFRRVEKGMYGLTEAGERALQEYSAVVEQL